MGRGGEPRAKTIGKCVTCGLGVREGDEQYDNADQVNLFHMDCAEANKREIERWNNDVRKDREARG